MSTERLVIDIEGNATKFNAAMQSATNRLNSFNTRITNTSRNLTRLQSQMAALGATVTGLNGAVAAATNNLNRTSTAANNAATNIGRARNQSNGLVNSFRQMVVGLSSVQTMFYQYAFFLGGFVASVIKINAEYERQFVLLKNLSQASTEVKRAAEAKDNVKYIWDMAANAPFSMQSLTDSFVKLKVGGIDPTNGSMKALVDSVAAFGGSSENLKRASVAIQQMGGKGVVSMEELRQQLGEAVPDAMQMMSSSMNMEMGKFVKAVSLGTVESNNALTKMFSEMRLRHNGAAKEMMDTWSGLIAQLTTAYSKFVVQVNESGGENGFFGKVKEQVRQLIAYLNTPFGMTFARQVSEALGKIVEGLANAIKFVYEWRNAITNAAKIFFTVWAGKMILGTIGLVVSALGTLIGTVSRLITFYRSFTTVANGAALVQLTFGRNVRAAATALGVFNAAGAISISRLAMIGARAMGVVGIMAALAGAIWAATRAQDAFNRSKAQGEELSRQARSGETFSSVEEMEATNQSLKKERAELLKSKAVVDLNKKIYGDAYKGDEALQKRIEAFDKKVANYRRVAANTRGAQVQKETNYMAGLYDEGTARVVDSVLDRYNRERIAIEQGSMSADAKTKAVAKLRQKTFTDEVKAIDDRTAMVKRSIEKFNKEGNAAYAKAGAAELKELEARKVQVLEAQQKDLDPNTMLAGKDESGGKKNKGPKEPKTDGLDGLRSRFVTLRVAGQELRYELGELKGEFDSWDEEEAARKVADGMGENALLKAINSDKDANKWLEKQKKVMDGLNDLTSDAYDQNLQAVEAIETQEAGYDSLDTAVTRYKANLIDRYKKEMALAAELDAKTGSNLLAGYNELINNSTIDFEKEKLADFIIEIKDANEQIRTELMTEDQRREYYYQKEVTRIQARLRQVIDTFGVESVQAKELQDYLDRITSRNTERRKGPWADWAREAQDIKPKIDSVLVGAMDGFIDSLAQGKFAFKDFAKALLVDLAKIIIRAMIAKAILAAIGGVTRAGVANVQSQGSLIPTTGPYAGAFHTGGIVGGVAPMSKAVSEGMFNYAKRYHTGGIVGLQPNEVPIIAERGEGVFTQEQMKALGNQQQGSNVQVNVINQTGTEAEVQRKPPKFDGEKWVEEIILKKMSRPGPVRDALGMRR